MSDYTSFRQRLDRVLRTQDVHQVQDFLIAEKQWVTGAPVDAEFAMWVMIAGSPTLIDLHARAGEWLIALAVLGKGRSQQKQHPASHKKGKSLSSDMKKQKPSAPVEKAHTQQRVKRTWTR